MNNKTTVLSVLIVFGIIGLMAWGWDAQKNKEVSASLGTHKASQTAEEISFLTAPESLYDFGVISMKNGLAEHVFKVTNSSDKDIELKKITTSCMCTSAYINNSSGEKGPFSMEGMGYVPPANEVVKTGETKEVRVVYDPNAHGPAGVGMIDRFIYLESENGEKMQFEIKANVTP